MPDVKRVRTVSAVMFWIATLVLVSLPIFAAWMAVAYTPERALLLAEFKGVALPETLSWRYTRPYIAAVCLPWAAALFVVWQMRRLFASYRRGALLSEGSAAAIRRIGGGVLAMLALQVLAHPLKVLALTRGNPEGQRSISIMVQSSDLALLLTGALILLIGWAMGEAVAAAEENRGFV